MDTILVITHNGKMPADGGLRLGYQVGPWVQPVAGGPLRFIGKPVSVAPKKEEVSPLVDYNTLPIVGPGMSQECLCGSTYNVSSAWMKTNQGEKRLLRCNKCGTLMRARSST